MRPTREQAWETLTKYTQSEALRRHALAVEAAVAAYAGKFGEDEELWRVTALLHDFDYEIHPTLDQHPQVGAPILRDEGYPEVVMWGLVAGIAFHGVETAIGLLFGFGAVLWFAPAIKARGRLTSPV